MKISEMTPEAAAKKRAQNKAAKERMAAKKMATMSNPLSSPLNQSDNPPLSSQSQSGINEPVLLAVDDSAPAAPPKPSRDEKEYTKLLEMYLGPATAFLILLLCFVMKIPGNQEYKEMVAGELAMNKDEQEMVIGPLARVLDKQHFPAHIKTAIVSSGDAIGLVLGLGAYGMRVFSALKILQGGQNGQFRSAPAQQAATEQPGGNGHNIGGFALAGFGQYTP